MVFTLIGDSTMNNLVWVFFSMAGIYTPTPFQNALLDPRKPLQQLMQKKCPRVLARVRVTCARGKLHYGMVSVG
jgi:hypothetical protein